jgi:hypothetical protein
MLRKAPQEQTLPKNRFWTDLRGAQTRRAMKNCASAEINPKVFATMSVPMNGAAVRAMFGEQHPDIDTIMRKERNENYKSSEILHNYD